MANRQFYTLKISSKKLKSWKNKLETTFSLAKKNGNIVALSDGQMLRTIRSITDNNVDLDLLEEWYKERDEIKKLPNSKINSERIFELQTMINTALFIPQYITVTMDGIKQYEKLYKEGFYVVIDGVSRHYKRIACSASQARVSTVAFCDSEIIDVVKKILNNGRDESVPMIPAKYNAYFGLYLSSSKIVRKPRFCVVKDYENIKNVRVNYVTQTDGDDDDLVDVRDMDIPFNRTDGMGLISPYFASLWAEDLGLDYTPAQFCIRQSWIKGMLCVFDIQDFCDKKNDGKYEIIDVWGNKVDLRNVDIVLSEGQFKLWDAYPNQKYYEECCAKNDLKWGVSIYTPKKDKNILNLNYQFLQTLDLDNEDIDDVCSMFIEWVSKVSFNDMAYTLLFLLGGDHTEKSIQNYVRSSDSYWIKSLLLCPELIHDKYIKQKIYSLIKTRITNGCLGELIANGNFQVLVSDPYGMMEHVCGLEVDGLLGEKEFYSNYWNEKGVSVVDGMRSPLTYRSEHVTMNLIQNKDTEYWYKHMYTGIVLNYHGHECMNFGGSDFDKCCRFI